MALPKLNELPTYTMEIPSTKETVKFRPFLVKEQKVLLIALESNDDIAIADAMVQTVKNCLHDDIDVSKLATFDIEYMFTQIRAKSVGETSEISIKCSECEHSSDITIKLDAINIDIDKDKSVIKLTDVYTLNMKYPNYEDIQMMTKYDFKNEADAILKLMLHCLDSILTEDERLDMRDETMEEKEAFIDSLTTSQFEMILEFMNNIPSLKQEINYTCTECGHDNSYTLQGIQDFF